MLKEQENFHTQEENKDSLWERTKIGGKKFQEFITKSHHCLNVLFNGQALDIGVVKVWDSPVSPWPFEPTSARDWQQR